MRFYKLSLNGNENYKYSDLKQSIFYSELDHRKALLLDILQRKIYSKFRRRIVFIPLLI